MLVTCVSCCRCATVLWRSSALALEIKRYCALFAREIDIVGPPVAVCVVMCGHQDNITVQAQCVVMCGHQDNITVQAQCLGLLSKAEENTLSHGYAAHACQANNYCSKGCFPLKSTPPSPPHIGGINK